MSQVASDFKTIL